MTSAVKAPVITLPLHQTLLDARAQGKTTLVASLDLGRSMVDLGITADYWSYAGKNFEYLQVCKDRSIYFWNGADFALAARYTDALIKLVPTDWGPPTFEIDGIKMLPTAQVSPFADAERKVGLIQAQGKTVLDTCGGLGYFAEWCLRNGARRVHSFEKNADVLWLRGINPWSPNHQSDASIPTGLSVQHADIAAHISQIPTASMDAILHDPPRFGIAGELYSQAFYLQLARVIKPQGRMFHYTGTPNKLTSGRDLPREVATRLQRAGFATTLNGDGVVAVKN